MSQGPNRVVGIIAWPTDAGVALRLAADVSGNPLDVDRAGVALRELGERLGVVAVGYRPASDRDVARHLDIPGVELTPFTAQLAAAASARFVATVQAGRLAWSDAELVGADLAMSVRRSTGLAPGTWTAWPGRPDHPIDAALAAIYAVWLATEPRDDVPTVHGAR